MKRTILSPCHSPGIPSRPHRPRAVRLLAQKVAVAVKDVEPFTYCSLSHKGPVSDIQDVIGQLILDMQSQGPPAHGSHDRHLPRRSRRFQKPEPWNGKSGSPWSNRP